MRVEEEFENVMMNIEMQVVDIARQNPKMTDWDVEKVYNALLKKYRAILKGRDVKEVSLGAPSDDLYFQVESVCDWLTGDAGFQNKDGDDVELGLEKVSHEDMVACLKRLRKSLKMWTKEGGRAGYINYISEFIPAPPDEDESVLEELMEETKNLGKPLHKKIGDGISSIFKKKEE